MTEVILQSSGIVSVSEIIGRQHFGVSQVYSWRGQQKMEKGWGTPFYSLNFVELVCFFICLI